MGKLPTNIDRKIVLKAYHSVATAQRMLGKLETYPQTLIRLQQQALQQTELFERRQN